MPHHKRKGDQAERECAALIADLLGLPVRRRLGAGRLDDIGDLDGLPGHVIQVASWKDVSRAAIVKPEEAEVQRMNDGAAFASTWCRFRGGKWRVVLTPEQWARLVQALQQQPPK